MKTKLFFILTAFFAGFLSLDAQTGLSFSRNGFRPGDKLTKQQVKYKDPGRTGIDVVWDFSQLKVVGEDYMVHYQVSLKKSKDSLNIFSVENNTMFKYVNKKDSLLLFGYENSGSQLNLVNPEYCLKYPFGMGDSISSHYNGNGMYDFALLSEISGFTSTVADASGTLILPDGDTIFNALRIKTENRFQQKTLPIHLEKEKMLPQIDSIFFSTNDESRAFQTDSSSTVNTTIQKSTSSDENAQTNEKEKINTGDITTNRITRKQLLNEKSDSLYFHTETCRWYAPGYRYPLFETICSHGKALPDDSLEINDMAIAFYFPPSKHTYLENDPKNKAILDSLKTVNETKNAITDKLLFEYNYYPNPVKANLELELLLNYASLVTIRIFDSNGNLVLSEQGGQLSPGIHRLTLKTSKLRYGEYVLHIVVNDQKAYALLLKI